MAMKSRGCQEGYERGPKARRGVRKEGQELTSPKGYDP